MTKLEPPYPYEPAREAMVRKCESIIDQLIANKPPASEWQARDAWYAKLFGALFERQRKWIPRDEEWLHPAYASQKPPMDPGKAIEIVLARRKLNGALNGACPSTKEETDTWQD